MMFILLNDYEKDYFKKIWQCDSCWRIFALFSGMVNIELLIHCVYKRRPEWDKRPKTHLNRTIIKKCLGEISSEMNIKGNFIFNYTFNCFYFILKLILGNK